MNTKTDSTERPLRDRVIMQFAESYPGIDCYGIYCQVTGKFIGTNHEVDDFFRAQPKDSDPESVADDLAIRIFASMRPSIIWNKMRAESLNELRKDRPVEVLAYLVNRAFNPLKSSGDYIVTMHDRIRSFIACGQLTDEVRDRLLYLLLEIDSKNGLNTVFPPFHIDKFLFDSSDDILTAFTAWHESCMKEFAKFERAREQETRWWRSGNALAKPAFFSAFMESKPVTEAAIKRAAKKEESDFFADILNEVMGKPKLDGTKQAPVPEVKRVVLPSTKMPALFSKKG